MVGANGTDDAVPYALPQLFTVFTAAEGGIQLAEAADQFVIFLGKDKVVGAGLADYFEPSTDGISNKTDPTPNRYMNNIDGGFGNFGEVNCPAQCFFFRVIGAGFRPGSEQEQVVQP